MCITSATGDTAGRSRAAKALLAQADALDRSAADRRARQTRADAGRKDSQCSAAFGLNLGDMVMQMGVGGLVGKAGSLGLMGASVAGDTTLDSLERGGTPGQALANATVAGAAEVLTEKLPVDQLFDLAKGTGKNGVRQVVRNLLGTMGSEGAQEAVTEIADNLADRAIMGDKSQYENYVRSLMAQGMDEQSARNAAAKQFYLSNVGQAAVGGALMGGIMGGGAQLIGYANGAQGRRESRAIDRAYQAMQADGVFSDQAAQARHEANRAIGLPVFRPAAMPLPLFDREGNQGNTDSAAPQARKTASTGEAVNENGLLSFSEQETINLSSGKRNKIITTFNGAIDFIRNALSNKQSIDRAYFGKVPESVAQRVKSDSGVDLTGFSVIMNGNDARHIMKDHGDVVMETARGQVAVTPDDIALVPQILAEPDNAYLSSDKDGKGRSVIVFEKQIGNKYITMQGVSDGKHALETDTLYIKKQKGPQDTGHNAAKGDPVINAQSVPPQSPSSAPIIADSSAGGNTQSAPNKGDLSAVDAGAISGAAYPKTMTVNGREYTVYQELPEGWSVNDRAMTAPNGYLFIHNNKSLFGGERKTALMPDKWLQDEMAREKRGTMDTPAPQQAQKTASTGEAVKADTSLFDRGILKNLNQARTSFIAFAREHFPSSVQNVETGKTIKISRNGLDKFLSGRLPYEKYATGFHIPELVERGHRVNQAGDYKGRESITGYEYYESPISVNGADYMAYIRVRNTTSGDSYYGHTIGVVDDIKIEPSARVDAQSAAEPVNAIDDSISNTMIPQTGEGVKREFTPKTDGVSPDDSTGAAPLGFDAYSHLQNQSGSFHPDGENAFRQVDVPTQDYDGRSIPKSAATVMESQAAPDSAVAVIRDAIARGEFSFDTITDQAAGERARKTVAENGFDGAKVLFHQAASRGVVSKNDIALGQVLLNNAMNAGDSGAVIDILTDYSALSTASA